MPASISATLIYSTPAPPRAVWAALEAAPRWREVLDDLASARIEPNGVIRVGAVMRSYAKPNTEAADMAYSVIEAERPSRLAIEAEVGNYRSRAVYDIEPAGGGARVKLTAEIVPTRGIDKLITYFARKRYLGKFKTGVDQRMAAMLKLAERIAREEA
jgi:hypothetical protein